MRIYGPTGVATNSPAAQHAARPAATFSVGEGEGAQPTGSAGPLRTVGGIDALIALQGIEDPTERRRHALKRGRHALDALDELKIGLLGGDLSPATLTSSNRPRLSSRMPPATPVSTPSWGKSSSGSRWRSPN